MSNRVNPDQTAPISDSSFGANLILVYTVCPDLSFRKLNIIMVDIIFSEKHSLKFSPGPHGPTHWTEWVPMPEE